MTYDNLEYPRTYARTRTVPKTICHPSSVTFHRFLTRHVTCLYSVCKQSLLAM